MVYSIVRAIVDETERKGGQTEPAPWGLELRYIKSRCGLHSPT